MNSKVKQSLREGVTSADIAAGLAYSAVKNCLYKVLKLKSPQELGNEIVLQGAPMKNDAVVRAFEILTGGPRSIAATSLEIMGAYVAVPFMLKPRAMVRQIVDDMIHAASFKDAQLTCHGWVK